MKWNVNIFAVSNTILHSLRIKLETCFFFNIPYLTILNTLEVSENTFSHQNTTFYTFFSIQTPTRGSCFKYFHHFQAHFLLSMRVSLEWLFNMLSI